MDIPKKDISRYLTGNGEVVVFFDGGVKYTVNVPSGFFSRTTVRKESRRDEILKLIQESKDRIKKENAIVSDLDNELRELRGASGPATSEGTLGVRYECS